MNFDKEITVRLDINKDELDEIINSNNFIKLDQYIVNDIYFTKEDLNSCCDYMDLVKNSLLIRNIIREDSNRKMITYKYKELDNNGDILKQGMIDLNILSIDEAINFMNALGYHELVRINDRLSTYSNGVDYFLLQEVNDNKLYIEIEEKCKFNDIKYNDIDSMKNVIDKYKIKIKNNNYYAKKLVDCIDERYYEE